MRVYDKDLVQLDMSDYSGAYYQLCSFSVFNSKGINPLRLLVRIEEFNSDIEFWNGYFPASKMDKQLILLGME